MRVNWLDVLAILLLPAGCSRWKEPQPPTSAELTTMLQSDDPKTQREGAHWVVQLGPKAADTAPALIAALKSPDVTVRQSAALALGTIGPEVAPEAVPPLTTALADPDASVQQAAADALGKMGPAAASAIPALERLADQPDKRCNAAPAALKKIKS